MTAAADRVSGEGERLHILDALRGWALLGILLANLMVFGGFAMMGEEARAAAWGAHFDDLAELTLEALVVGKFYSLFSLLFGIGFAIQLASLERSGEGAARYVRRLLVLFGFGLFHLYVLWMGDILALYATMGGVLLLFRRASDRTLLVAAALLWLLPIAWSAMINLAGIDPSRPFFALAFAGFARLGDMGPLELYRDAPLVTQLAARQAEVWFRLADLTYQLRPAKVLAMFLIGLWVGRRLITAGVERTITFLRRSAAAGLLVGLPLSLARAVTGMAGGEGEGWRVLEEALYCLSTPTLAIGYASGFALAWNKGQAWLEWTAAAGRMALTNYLAQSLLGSLLFYSWGLALMGRLGLASMIPIGLALFAMQAAASRWWLERFRFGPCEWLWRSLTYGRAQPMRLPRPATPLRA